MAKGTRVRDQDKFMLRLPDGMRDRIKAKADRAGMSMNEAIVWCLEQHFPAPASLEERLDELATMVAILAQGEDARPGVERLIDEIQTTLERISEGQIPAGQDFQSAVRERLERWAITKAEDWEVDHASPFEEDMPIIVRNVLSDRKPD